MNDHFSKMLKTATATSMIAMLATALLWLVFQHVSFLNLQAEAIKQQTTSLQVLSQISQERLEIMRNVHLNQMKILTILERIEKRQRERPGEGC